MDKVWLAIAVMAVVTAVSEYDYDYLKPKIVASFGKVVDILGDSVKNFMLEAQTNYYNGAQGLTLQQHIPHTSPLRLIRLMIFSNQSITHIIPKP